MSDLLRRSPRLSQQYQQNTLPALSSCSAPSSTSTTTQPSPTDDPTKVGAHQNQLSLQIQSPFLCPPAQSIAPLPSPSAQEENPFFGTSHFQMTSQMPQQAQSSNTSSQHGQFAQGSLQRAQSGVNQQHSTFSQSQRQHIVQGSHKPGEVPPPGFLAEAAKRAQMACLMRDLGDVTL